MINKFKSSFDSFACIGDTIEYEKDGVLVVAVVGFDVDYTINDDDCHSLDQSVTGCSDVQHEKSMQARKAWENNEWFYCWIALSISVGGVVLDECIVSLGGIECNYPDSDNSYLTEAANEMLDEALDSAKKLMDELLEKLAAARASLR